MEERPKDIVVTPKSVGMHASVPAPTLWTSDNYAEDWYRDALTEARGGGDHDARRREIIFSVCFLEAFIFEWTRRRLGPEEINEFFPPERRCEKDPRYRRKLLQKWTDLPKDLYQAGKIHVQPTLDLSGLRELLAYRHGLIHAAGSRPDAAKDLGKAKPFPRKEDLKALRAGWAARVAFNLVAALCAELGESTPTYLEEPEVDS